jgi:hypothetical protein
MEVFSARQLFKINYLVAKSRRNLILRLLYQSYKQGPGPFHANYDLFVSLELFSMSLSCSSSCYLGVNVNVKLQTFDDFGDTNRNLLAFATRSVLLSQNWLGN